MPLIKLFQALIFFCFFLISCEKKKVPVVNTGKSTYELLTQNKWLLVESYTNSIKNGVLTTENLFDQLDSCEKDDLLIFNTDSNAIVIDQGTNKCNPGEPQQASPDQRWALNGESYVSYLDIPTQTTYEVAIIELSETTYHIRRYGTSSDSTYFETTHKYKAK